jgi:hypothetical protein
MIGDTQLLPLFLQDDNLIDKLMSLLPILKVRIVGIVCLNVCVYMYRFDASDQPQ